MNIVVRTSEGKYIVRPDTTWERDNEDIYVPEFVSRISWTPVLFARVSKPGRSVGEDFAERYYDGIGYGVLLYPEDMCDGSETGFACASCLDHTSFLPFPVYNKVTLDRPGNVFELGFKAIEPAGTSVKLFSHSDASSAAIRKAIAEATSYIYIRTGDIIAIELQPRKPLCSREKTEGYTECGRANLKASFCENETVDFDIVF